MKRMKKVQKKLDARTKGYQELLKKQKYEGQYTAPGSRQLKQRG